MPANPLGSLAEHEPVCRSAAGRVARFEAVAGGEFVGLHGGLVTVTSGDGDGVDGPVQNALPLGGQAAQIERQLGGVRPEANGGEWPGHDQEPGFQQPRVNAEVEVPHTEDLDVPVRVVLNIGVGVLGEHLHDHSFFERPAVRAAGVSPERFPADEGREVYSHNTAVRGICKAGGHDVIFLPNDGRMCACNGMVPSGHILTFC